MSNPTWLDDLLAGVMAAVAIYSVARLVASRVWSRPTHRDVDAAHVLMGASMAGQLVSDLDPITSGVWEVVFSFLAAWFVWRCYEFVRSPGIDSRYDDHVHRLSRRLVHLTMALAMLYMYLAATPAELGSGMAMGTATGTTADFVLVPMVFILVLLASAIWQLDAIGRFAPSPDPGPLTQAFAPAGGGSSAAMRDERATPMTIAASTVDGAEGRSHPWLAPRLEAGAHIVMSVTMAYMLVLML
ncbi:MAG: DUF5134 domain-containing protein [Acidimicrobiales bacterium]